MTAYDDAIPDLLGTLPLFAPLSQSEREQLAKDCRIRTFSRDALLFQENEPAKGMFVVLEGVVKVISLTPDGREVVLHLIRKGNTLGEAAVFQRGTFPAAAQAVQAVKALYINADALLQLVTENPEVALRMLAALSLRLRMFSHKVAAQGQGGATQRLAAYILHRSQLQGNTPVIFLDVSREVLANLLGLARETLSRQFSGFVEAGALEIKGREIRLLDRDLLAAFAQGARSL